MHFTESELIAIHTALGYRDDTLVDMMNKASSPSEYMELSIAKRENTAIRKGIEAHLATN